MQRLMKSCLILGASVWLVACAASPKTEFVKDGATDFDRSSALSDCTYQIKLGKADDSEAAELLTLCMEGKGYRSIQVRQ